MDCIDWLGTASRQVQSDSGVPTNYNRLMLYADDNKVYRIDAVVVAVYYQSRTFTYASEDTEQVTAVPGATRTRTIYYNIYEVDEWRYEGTYNAGPNDGEPFISPLWNVSYEGYMGYHTRTIVEVYE